MDPVTLRYLIAIGLAGHGIGHVVGYWGSKRESWLFSRWLPEETIWAIEQLWMGVAVVLFAVATLSLVGFGISHAHWRQLAIAGSLLSALGLVVFWRAWPGSSALFALVFDLIVLGALLLLEWPPESAIGFEPTAATAAQGGTR